LVIDDGSTDNTAEHVSLLAAEDSRVTLIRKSNAGASSARNLGIALSRTPWIAFLDSDDEWIPGRLDNIHKLLHSSPYLEFIHGNKVDLNPAGEILEDRRRTFSPERAQQHSFLLANMQIKTSTVLIRRDLVSKEEPWFRENLKTCEDYEFFWRMILKTNGIGYDPEENVLIHHTRASLMDQTTEISKLRDNLLARHHLVSSTTFHKSKNKKLKNIVYHGMVQEVKNLLGSARKISFSNAFKQAMWINNNINYNPFIPYIAIKFRQKSMSFVKVIFLRR